MLNSLVTVSLAFIVAVVIVGLAGLVRGFSGFGSALIMSPALSLLFGPQAAVASISLVDVPALLYLLPEAWRHGQWRSVLPLGLAGVSMIPAGAWLLVRLDPDLMRRSIGVVVLGFVGILARGWRYRGEAGLGAALGVGATSRLLGGAMSVSGPPVILFYLSGPAHARVARASIMAYFLLTSATSIVTYAFYGLYTESVVYRTVGFIPAYLGGVWFGNRLFGRVSEATFRRLALLVLTAIALAALVI